MLLRFPKRQIVDVGEDGGDADRADAEPVTVNIAPHPPAARSNASVAPLAFSDAFESQGGLIARGVEAVDRVGGFQGQLDLERQPVE